MGQRKSIQTRARGAGAHLAVMILAAVSATTAVASSGEDLEARVEVFLDERGQASVSMVLPAAPLETVPVQRALGEAVGCRLVDIETEEDEDGWWLTSRCAATLPLRPLAVNATVYPAALTRALQEAGIGVLTVEVMHPRASFASHPDFRLVREAGERGCLLVWSGRVGALPEALPVTFGFSGADLALRAGVPLLFLLLPPGLVWWLRRRALTSAVSDPAVMWFRFMKSFNVLVLGTWLGWIGALWFADTARLVGFLQFSLGLGAVSWVSVAVYFVPPGLVHALLTQIAYPVLRGVRGMEVSRGELLRQAWWTQATLVLPLLLAVAGLDAFTRHAPRLAVGLWGAAGAAFLVASRHRGRALRLEPHALTEGELRDRVFELAARAGVGLKQIYVLPALKARLANALAAVGNVVLLTDYLLQNLSRREVDAVVAHELAHLKRRHPLLLVALLTALIAASVMWGGRWNRYAVPLAPLFAILVVLLVSRSFERGADTLAARVTGDPEALITALVKLASLNVLPLHWGKLDEALLTHPSVRRRALTVAASSGVSEARVEELLRGEGGVEDRYPLPAGLGASGPIFSSRFRRDVAVLNTWAQILAVTLTPAAAAWLAAWWSPSPWLVYIAGAMLTLAVCLALANFLPPIRQRRLSPRLAAFLVRDGFPETAARGTLVGLSPSPQPRLYESNLTWDMGMMVTDGDRLGYVGEQARLALERTQVTSIRLGPSHPGWWSTGSVLVAWRDDTSGRAGSFQIRPMAVTSLTHGRRQAIALLHRLEAWWKGQAAGVEPLPELQALPAPRFGEVTSQTPRGSLRPVGCLVLLAVVELIAAGLAVLLGLGVWGGIYVFVVAALALVLLILPALVHRDRAAPGTG